MRDLPSWVLWLQAFVSILLAAYGLAALFIGPLLYVRGRKHFVERGHAITGEQLQGALARMERQNKETIAAVDHNAREAWNREMSLLSARIEQQYQSFVAMVREAEQKATRADERSTAALHQAQMVAQQQESTKDLLCEKIDGLHDLFAAFSKFRTRQREQKRSGTDG